MTGNRSLRTLLAAALAVLLAVAGCGQPDTAGSAVTGAAVAATAGTLTDQDCAWTTEVAPTPGAPGLAVVDDTTASRTPTAWPDAVVADAVAVAVGGGTLTVVAVDGPGAPATVVWPRSALLPEDLKDTPRQDAVVRTGLACAYRAARAVRPAAPGSDVVTAIDAAVNGLGANRSGARLDVVTDGWSTGGPLRMDAGVDPGETPVETIAAALADRRSIVRLDGVAVTLYGIGAFAGRPGDEAVTRWMEELYTRICTVAGAVSCTTDRDPGAPITAPQAGPADEVHLAAPQPPVTSPVPDVRRLGGNTFFEPGSAVLRPGTDGDLTDLAAMLAPGHGYRAEIVGHVASWGELGYRDRLSADRADAIRSVLVRLGADPGALTARGAGSRERLVDDLGPDGGLLPAQAAQNRRVDIRLVPTEGA